MTNKIKVGIFFGGQSREREISFRGGRTTLDHINKAIFEPVPIFIDSLGNFILINPELLYEEAIPTFYPSKNLNRGFRVYIEHLGKLNETQLYKLIYKIGKQIKPENLAEHIDFAFLVLHGPHAEDGSIQGLMEWFGIPYLGPGILGSAVGVDKPVQNKLLALATGQQKKMQTITSGEWHAADRSRMFMDIINTIGFPFVVKSPHQGSSIGVAIVRKRSLDEFVRSMNKCFFEVEVTKKEWDGLSTRQKKNYVEKIASLEEGISLPASIHGKYIAHPAELIEELDALLFSYKEVLITSVHSEYEVLIEEFTTGQEFSCGIIQDDTGAAFALPPTEITAEQQAFDFKAKYETNTTKKNIPVNTSTENLLRIEEQVLKAFTQLNMGVICRIDGFLTPDNRVILHDPNSLPGMSPTSLIFKQMAEIGLNVTNSISYLVRQSVKERIRSGKNTFHSRELLSRIDTALQEELTRPRKKVAILFGENDDEYLHAQQKYGEYAASADYEPVPVCVAGNGSMYRIPLNLMAKPNIFEFGVSVGQGKHEFITRCIKQTEHIVKKYVGDVHLNVSKITATDLANEFQLIYQVDTEQILEL
ncbi:MAG: D-alanine--D-alanine ligase [Spirosomaceae bacterium]|nr:D-alanine--D-alanine ligase [Spirosomataceae bacterium]